MIDWIKDNPHWVAVFIGSLAEFYLGRSQKIKANSILEFLIQILVRRKK